MSEQQEIFRRIDDLKEQLAAYDEVSPDEEDAFGFMLSQQSLKSRLDELNLELIDAVDQNSASLFNYRIFAGQEESIKMGAIGHALANFQSLFGMVVDAIKNGPKLRATIDAAMASLTAFSFEYSYVRFGGIYFHNKRPECSLRTNGRSTGI